jgi:hypothetical protein
MIISAAVFRIVGFIKKDTQTIENEFQEGQLALCYSERGKPVVLQFKSNKKDATNEDFKNYLISKRNGLIKSKEIESVAGELEYVDSISIEIEEMLENFKKENPGIERKEVMAEKKKITLSKAEEIVIARRTIGPGTIIRSAVSLPDPGKKYEMYSFKGQELPVIESRSIIYDNEGLPSSSGFYLFSQMANALPITIAPAFNKDNEPLNFFTIKLSKLARLDHFELLTNHIKRSIEKQFAKEGKANVPRISYDYEYVKEKPEIKEILKDLYQFSKEKTVDEITKDDFLEKFERLVNLIKSTPKLLTVIQIELNLIISPKLLEGAFDKTSPFTQLPKSMVALNKSKENPDVKENLRESISAQLKLMAAGEINFELNSIYHTPALRLSEDPDSWGFMENNIQIENLVLSISDTAKLIS